MLKKSFYLCAILIVSSISSIAQKNKSIPGKVVLENGDVKEGLIVPLKGAGDKALGFYENEDAKKEMISSEDIKEFYLSYEETEEASKFVKRSFYKLNGSVKPGKFWVQELVTGEASLYSNYTPGNQRFTSNGFTGMSGDVTFFGMKSDDEALTTVGVYFTSAMNMNANSSFRKMAAKFFEDEPSLVTRIEEKEWEILQIGDLFETYNELKSSK